MRATRNGGRALGRAGGRIIGRVAIVAALVLTARPPDLSAQAGHDPANSPYRDIRRGLTLRITQGYFGGSRGPDSVPVAATQGQTTGARLELQASGALTVAAGVSYANTTAKYFRNASDSLPKSRGPIDNDLVLADFGILLSLTGGKTWRGFQPYAGATLGLAFGSRIGADSSGYNFGTKFTYAPELGLRWYPARRLSAEIGGRLLVYHLSFPSSYRLRILPNILSPLSATTIHPWATFGLAWTF